MFSKNHKKAFTLIELLVVIAVIGLMSGIVFLGINGTGAKARDTRRKNDLSQIELALQIYYAEKGVFPVHRQPCGSWASWCTSSLGGIQWLTADSDFYKYMPLLPKDPINRGDMPSYGGSNYVYAYGQRSGGQGYSLIALLENPSDPDRCGLKHYRVSGRSCFWCDPNACSPSDNEARVYSKDFSK